jgi:hypothetical protein
MPASSHPEEDFPEIQSDSDSASFKIWAGFNNDDQKETHLGLSDMPRVREKLKTSGSDTENTPGHAVGLPVAEWFAAEPPLEIESNTLFAMVLLQANRRKRDNCPCFNVFFGAKATPM